MSKHTEYKERCGLCLESKNNPTFARIYYKQINEEFIHLCADCWEIAESENLYVYVFGGSGGEIYWSGNETGVKILFRYANSDERGEIRELKRYLKKAQLGWTFFTTYGGVICFQSKSATIKMEG